GFGSDRIVHRALRVVPVVVPVLAPLPDAASKVQDAVGTHTVLVNPRRGRRMTTALLGVAARRVPVVTPGIPPGVVAPRRSLPFGLCREPASGPGAEGTCVIPRHVRDREALGHSPHGSFGKGPARLPRESQVLAPGDLHLVHQEALEADDVLRMLGGLTLAIGAPHPKLAAGDPYHDRAIPLAPELLAPLRVALERALPRRPAGGPARGGG